LTAQRVHILKVPSYEEKALEKVLSFFSDTFDVFGKKILLKPNWVSFRQAELSCTHPMILRVLSRAFLDAGAQVLIGDSPAFGTSFQVFKASQAKNLLSDLPVKVVKFSPGPSFTLPCGVKVRLAREIFEVDAVINVPRLKAHNQLLLTLAVKNLFGCVVGLQKPFLHARIGHLDDLFPEMLLEIAEAVPVSWNVLDAIVAMERKGPIGGAPCPLGLLLVSEDAVALDTVVYTAMKLSPEEVPLWRVARKKKHPGAFIENITFDFLPALQSFLLPPKLAPITFHPLRLLKGLMKRGFWRLFG